MKDKIPEKVKKNDKIFVKVIPGLFIGSWKSAVRRGSLSKKGITHILNTTAMV